MKPQQKTDKVLYAKSQLFGALLVLYHVCQTYKDPEDIIDHLFSRLCEDIYAFFDAADEDIDFLHALLEGFVKANLEYKNISKLLKNKSVFIELFRSLSEDDVQTLSKASVAAVKAIDDHPKLLANIQLSLEDLLDPYKEGDPSEEELEEASELGDMPDHKVDNKDVLALLKRVDDNLSTLKTLKSKE